MKRIILTMSVLSVFHLSHCKSTNKRSSLETSAAENVPAKFPNLNFSDIFVSASGLIVGKFDAEFVDNRSSSPETGRVDDKAFYGDERGIVLLRPESGNIKPDEMGFGLVDPVGKSRVTITYNVNQGEYSNAAYVVGGGGSKHPLKAMDRAAAQKFLELIRQRKVPIYLSEPARKILGIYQSQASKNYLVVEEFLATQVAKDGKVLKSDGIEMMATDHNFFALDSQEYEFPKLNSKDQSVQVFQGEPRAQIDTLAQVAGSDKALNYIRDHHFGMDLASYSASPSLRSLIDGLAGN